MGTGGSMSALILFLGVYFIPAFIAFVRKIPSSMGVLLTNIFFGWTVIGWLVALIWAVSGDSQVEDESESSLLVECPACKNEVSKNAESCPKCGEPIKFDEEIEDDEKQEQVECVKCGEKYDSGEEWCPECGSKYTVENPK